jgi:hypothetical protein
MRGHRVALANGIPSPNLVGRGADQHRNRHRCRDRPTRQTHRDIVGYRGTVCLRRDNTLREGYVEFAGDEGQDRRGHVLDNRILDSI